MSSADLSHCNRPCSSDHLTTTGVQAALTDTLQFGFSIAATNFSATPTQSALTGATGANNATTAATCATLCPLGLEDIVCHMKHKCWSSLLVFFVVMALILIASAPPGCTPPVSFAVTLDTVIDYSALSHRLLPDLQASTHFCAESWCCAVFMIYIGFTHGWWWAATKMSVRALHRWSKKPSRPPPGSILLSDKSIAALPSASTHVAGSGSYSIRANPMFAGNDEEAAPGPRGNQASSHGKASRL